VANQARREPMNDNAIDEQSVPDPEHLELARLVTEIV
jgi:hypothetical protein